MSRRIVERAVEWQCDCCGQWVAEGSACTYGTTVQMYDTVGAAMLLRRDTVLYVVEPEFYVVAPERFK